GCGKSLPRRSLLATSPISISGMRPMTFVPHNSWPQFGTSPGAGVPLPIGLSFEFELPVVFEFELPSVFELPLSFVLLFELPLLPRFSK
ncbi:MAG: hypothetical protein KDA71_07870, partial [Planctomycetales bacterium]|nr:hypothetical protein [Planctomycetales bacterium]